MYKTAACAASSDHRPVIHKNPTYASPFCQLDAYFSTTTFKDGRFLFFWRRNSPKNKNSLNFEFFFFVLCVYVCVKPTTVRNNSEQFFKSHQTKPALLLSVCFHFFVFKYKDVAAYLRNHDWWGGFPSRYFCYVPVGAYIHTHIKKSLLVICGFIVGLANHMINCLCNKLTAQRCGCCFVGSIHTHTQAQTCMCL